MKGTDRFYVDGVICRLNGLSWPVANVSISGLFVATDFPLAVGQVVDFELVLQDRTPFRALAKVTWLNDPAEPKAPDLPRGFGFQIIRIGLAEKLAIVDLLKRASPTALLERRQEHG